MPISEASSTQLERVNKEALACLTAMSVSITGMTAFGLHASFSGTYGEYTTQELIVAGVVCACLILSWVFLVKLYVTCRMPPQITTPSNCYYTCFMEEEQ